MQAVRAHDRWMLRLDEREDVLDRLVEFSRTEGIRAGAIVSGIGQTSRATIGFWDGSRYRPHELDGPHEVLALSGSIAQADGAPSLHLHLTAAGADYRAVGGHLLAATVGVLLELVVEVFPGRAFGRPMSESQGLRRLDLDPGSDV